MDERTRRVGLNEALFREVNDRVREINATFASKAGVVDVICECGSAECTARMTIDQDEYEAVRADGARFVVAPGHEKPDVEHVVKQTDTYAVLEKDPGSPEDLARATHPR